MANSTEEKSAPGASDQTGYPFDAMKLKVGDRLQIQPPPQLPQDRIVVRLVGYVPHVSLMVSAPTDEAGFRLQLLEGEILVIRVFSAQNAFGFSTPILKICKSPFDYLHLGFPEEVQGMVIRTAPRVRTRIIAAISKAGQGEEKVSGIISNLSANGAMIDAVCPLAAKNEIIRIAFKINLHGFDSILELDAAVRAVTNDAEQAGSATPYRHGVQFTDLQPNHHMLLQSMIYQQMVEHPESVT